VESISAQSATSLAIVGNTAVLRIQISIGERSPGVTFVEAVITGNIVA